ncbi:hypothetical protein CPB86DRAFT_565601 [Serendipita vermifera]|nr:hypothetical protein CPB86DRAFT_565601 [Serendipita vermifera]
MFLEDELDLANKWTQSDDKPRREARWSLVFAVRHEDLRARLFDPGVISTIKQLLVQNDRNDKKEDVINMLSQIVEYHDKLSGLFDHDTIKIIHSLLLDSPGDIKEKAVSFLEKAMKYERFRSALFDDALFQGLVTSFREGGPYKLGPLKVRILGIGIQYEEIRNKLLLSDLAARFQNAFVHPWRTVQVEGLKVLEIMTNYVDLHTMFFDTHTIKIIEDATENDSWGESIDILKASLTCHELSLKLFTPAIIAKIPKILLDGGNLNIMIRNKTLYLLKDLVVHGEHSIESGYVLIPLD